MKTKFKAATLFVLSEQIPIESIHDLPLWQEPEPGIVHSIGLTPISKELAVPLGNSGVWFRLKYSERKVSPSHLAHLMGERIAELEQKLDRKIRGKEKLDVRDNILLELLKTAQPDHNEVDVMFRDGWFIVCSASAPVCDKATSFLREKLGSLPIKAAQMESMDPLTMIGKGVLGADGLMVDNIQLGDKIKIRKGEDTAEQKAERIAVTHGAYDQDLLKLLQSGSTVESMSIDWGDYSVSLKPDMTSLSSIKDHHEPSEDFSAYEDKQEREFMMIFLHN